MQLASEIGETNIQGQLEEILGVSLSQEVNTDNTFVYVIVLGKERIPILIMQFKKEIGEDGCDPSIQCGLSMRQLWIQPERKSMREKCCCPTLLLAGGGPWLGVLGAVFTDKIIVQRLTDMMWIGHSSTYEDGRLYRLTQTLVALREAVHSLKESYEDVHQHVTPYKRDLSNPNKPHPRFFPYPTSFTENHTSITIKFKYLKPLQKSPRCVTFLAQTDDNSLVVVKFVDRYGREVHEFLAKEGYAPKLHYCGSLPLQLVQPQPASTSPIPGLSFGPLQMVVMDYVEPLSEDLPATARPQIEEILKKMHKEGYVFGDLREPNIIFNKNKIQLIDFDWAGVPTTWRFKITFLTISES
ncbi:hypothetical protein BDQ12DRAFT_612898 [Crucibulum laeve]|uniref:Protein kinase domain-containing protein n=1 Tax=Crucibulum laeve TaxID=68775 RepID=A0A5C3LPF5_9AGAR|nr:hypothetical protein BDQ12DRAFT_612898 [Crucibulum laeve]